MVSPLPFPHQLGALAQPDGTAPDEIAAVRHGRGELGQPARAAGAQPAMDLLLQLPGDAEQQQLAAEPRRRQRAVQPSPLRPQSFRIHLRDRRELGGGLGRAPGPLARSAAVGFRLRRVRRFRRRLMFLAIIERHGLRPPRPNSVIGRRLVGRHDAISRLAVLAAALLQRAALAAQAGERGAGGVWQPAGGGDQLVQRGTLLPREQSRDQRLLGAGSKREWAGRKAAPLSVRRLAVLVRARGLRRLRSAADARRRDRASPRAVRVRRQAPPPWCGRWPRPDGGSPAWRRPWSWACAACPPGRSGWWRAGRW